MRPQRATSYHDLAGYSSGADMASRQLMRAGTGTERKLNGEEQEYVERHMGHGNEPGEKSSGTASQDSSLSIDGSSGIHVVRHLLPQCRAFCLVS
jgi:hypothetical protein